MLTEGIAIILFFSCVFGIVYIIFTTRHRERMAMIERGIDLSAGTAFRRKRDPNPRRALKEGMQWVAASIGLGVGYLIDMRTDVDEPFVYLGAIAFFVGAANIIYHLLFHKKELREANGTIAS